MKNFINYITTIAKDPFAKTAKHSTAILLPELDTTEGIYRSLLPSYVLNSLDDYRVIVMGIHQSVGASNNAKDFEISQHLISETDHIVLPFVSFPLQQVVDQVRAVKPSMYFSYYIDANYYIMPDAYPFAKEYNQAKMIDNIEANIKAVDQVIVTSRALRDYIFDKLKERHPGETFGTQITWQPLLVMPSIMKAEYDNKPVKGKIKLLIVGDQTHFSDINFIKGILKDLKVKYKEAVEIHIIGFNGKRGDKNWLADLDFKYYDRVPFHQYFDLIRHIGPNLLMIPAKDTPFNNTSKNYIKYLEFAYLNIPVLAPNIKPFGNSDDKKEILIVTNQNGFLCSKKEDYFMQVELMFTAPEKYEAVTGPAYATMTDYIINAEGNINHLKKIYFPHVK